MNQNKFINVLFISLGGLLALLLIFPVIKIITSTDFSILVATFKDSKVLSSVLLTIQCAAYATLFATFLGIPLAYGISRYEFKGKMFLRSALNIPVIIPHSAAGIALLTVFSNRFFIGRFFNGVGISFVDSKWGIALAMFFVSAPFLITASIDAFAGIDERIEKTARTLGADFITTFTKITLPLAFKGILNGAMMMWARGISEFGAVVILAYHPTVAPVMIFERFESYGLEYSKPVASLLIIICLIIFFLLNYINYRTQRRDEDA